MYKINITTIVALPAHPALPHLSAPYVNHWPTFDTDPCSNHWRSSAIPKGTQTVVPRSRHRFEQPAGRREHFALSSGTASRVLISLLAARPVWRQVRGAEAIGQAPFSLLATGFGSGKRLILCSWLFIKNIIITIIYILLTLQICCIIFVTL